MISLTCLNCERKSWNLTTWIYEQPIRPVGKVLWLPGSGILYKNAWRDLFKQVFSDDGRCEEMGYFKQEERYFEKSIFESWVKVKRNGYESNFSKF